MSRSSRLPSYLLLAAVLGGFALTLSLFYPGLTTPDSDFQLMQTRSFTFSDGHPPIMALFWSVMIKLMDGPAPMMLTFAALYWGSFFLLARTLAMTASKGAAVFLLACAFSPLLLNYAGVIWKDVFVFNLFLLAFALTFANLAHGRHLSAPAFAGIAVLILIGSLGRHNSIFSGLPLMVLALFAFQRGSARTVGGFLRLFARGSVLYVVLLLIAYYIVKLIAQPAPTSPSSTLFVFDLIGMSLQTQQYLLPASKTYTLASLQTCYDPAGWDRVWLSCAPLLEELRGDGSWAQLSSYWFKALAAHPLEYLQHRMGHLGALFTPTWLVFVNDPTPLAAEFGFTKGAGFLLFERMMLALRTNPVLGILFTNGFWIVVNTFLMLFAMVRVLRSLSTHNVAIFLLLLSGFLYSSPFILIGTAPDFRYVYWSIGACLVSATLYAARYGARHPHPAGKPLPHGVNATV